jgi:nicotinamide-nucleotide amidase
VRAEVVAVGTELLLGQIADENARWISEHLAAIGVDVLHHQVVGDNGDRIVEALHLATSRADAVLVTGGLGPTQDDITRDSIAELLRVPLVHRPEIERLLRAKFSGIGRPMSDNNLRQAQIPQGSRYITPIRGTAPGLIAEFAGSRIYAVPGVPVEMIEMMEGSILPELIALGGAGSIASRTVRCVGISESRIAEVLDDLFNALTNPTVAYLASSGEVKVRLTAKATTATEAAAIISPVAKEVVARLGDAVFSIADERLEEVVVRLLEERGATLVCAESLTGGGVATRITSVPGASRRFVGSAVVYTADAKRSVLGVSEETLAGPGPVSEQCAREMAVGARRLFHADLALALTGAAGPEPHGGAEPGTVWIALEGADVSHARTFRAGADRDRVRRWAEQGGLDLVRRYLEGRDLPTSDRII